MLIPTTCPSCSSTLERVKDQLFCRSSSCPAQNSKLVENFCKKMKIKGFGEKTIAKLELSSIGELYSLKHNCAAAILGEKVATKLISEIDAKRTVDFGTFIGSVGIPLIGAVAGKKIATVVTGWDSLHNATTILGKDSKALASLTKWEKSSAGIDIMLTPITFSNEVSATVTTSKPDEPAPFTVPFRGNVVITGSLDNFKSRDEAIAYLKAFGYDVKQSVNSKTKFMIVEDGSTSIKTRKANDLNIPIITILKLIGE
jgi:NAD-dependent DNA ligase